jgi:hypothetical protein
VSGQFGGYLKEDAADETAGFIALQFNKDVKHDCQGLCVLLGEGSDPRLELGTQGLPETGSETIAEAVE